MATLQTGKATDLITFSRTSNATVTDSDGKIKWAPHNLLLASEQFDSASWLKTNAGSTTPTVTANAAVAPNGTTTAETVALGAIDAAGDSSVVYQTFTAVDATYRGGVYVKAATGGDVGKKVWMFMYDSAYRGVASVTLTTEWQLLSSTATLTAGSNRELYIATIGSTNGGENQGAVSVNLWGAHLYRSDLGGMKANTSAYPTYNPTTVKNLVGFSEDWSNAAWTKNAMLGFGSGSVANAVVGPNGLQTADLLVESTALSNHGVYQSAANQVSSTFSFYAKAAGRNFVALRLYTTINDWVTHVFDLSIGTRTQTSAGSASTYSAVSSSIQAANNGFYRISLSAVRASGTTFYAIDFCTSGTPTLVSATGDQSYTGDGTSGIYLWGAQLSDSASLDPYVPNYGAAPTAAAYYGPRLDFDGSTLAAKGLLVEESRTNLLTASNDLTSFSISPATGLTSSLNAGTAPDGTNGSRLLTNTTTTELHRLFLGVTLPSATTHTYSVYAKRGTADWMQLSLALGGVAVAYANFNLLTGQKGNEGSGTGTITPVGNGWYRCSLTGTATQQGANVQLYVLEADAGQANPVTTGTGKSLYVYGAQLEAGSFATSYIPTGAATATRNADVASVSTSQFPYSATEGTLVGNFSFLGGSAVNSSTQAASALRDTSANSAIFLYNGGGKVSAYCVLAGVDQAYMERNTVAAGVSTKLAFAFKANDFAASQDGGVVATDPSGTLPSPNVMALGSNGTSSSFLNGHLRQITYIPRRLTNAELQTRTSA